MRTFIFIMLLNLAACTNVKYATVADTFEPNERTAYFGVKYRDPINKLLDYEAELESYCSSVGRKLDKNSVETVNTNLLGGASLRYHCVDIPKTNPAQSTYSQDKGGAANGIDNTQNSYEPINTSNFKTIPVEKSLSPLDLSSAKTKCLELGFKPKTEKFGKCVLELTK